MFLNSFFRQPRINKMIIGKIKPILVVQKRKEKWSFFLDRCGGYLLVHYWVLYKIHAPSSWIFTKQRQHKKSKKSDNANHWVLRYFVCETMHVQQLIMLGTPWNAKETTTKTRTAAAGFYVFWATGICRPWEFPKLLLFGYSIVWAICFSCTLQCPR